MKYYKINGEQCTKEEKMNELKFLRKTCFDVLATINEKKVLDFDQFMMFSFMFDEYVSKVETNLKQLQKRGA